MIILHGIGINKILENKIFFNSLYLIIIIFIFLFVNLISLLIKKMNYLPFLNESFFLETIIWIFSCLIIIILSIYSFKSSFYLNSVNIFYKNLKPLIIEIISLNWKWIIIYPKQKILTINEICLPILTPIKIYLISNSLMNSLCIPKIGQQIYCMSGCCKHMNTILLKHGIFHSSNSNYSGIGSSYMKITFFSILNNYFYNWVNKIKNNNFFFNFHNYNFISKYSILTNSKFFNIRNNKIFFLTLKK